MNHVNGVLVALTVLAFGMILVGSALADGLPQALIALGILLLVGSGIVAVVNYWDGDC